jgi:hypothetical protein
VQEISPAGVAVGFSNTIVIEIGKSRGIALWRGFGGVPHFIKSPKVWGTNRGFGCCFPLSRGISEGWIITGA